ncbi:MAG: DEAD/DEAH box helicase [Deltaproteobacteria bacterium]|nr:DEAD/DEAH box helicase [Deltaproteobacteria bacterium]
MGFEEPTHIQKIVIPPALEGRDVMGQAQTGTGKTAAFGIPIIEQRPDIRTRLPYAIALAPTRELAVQVSEELNKIGARSNIISLPIYGGQSIEVQIRSLKKGADIIVGTPGRLLDHLRRKTLSLKGIRTVVLVEADEMLNMGFIEDIEKILSEAPKDRQTMLFSATMPQEMLRIAKNYMKNPAHIKVDSTDMVVTKIKQIFYEVREEDKMKALTRLLDIEGPSLTLVFCHTKREVDDVAGKLQQMGYPSGAIHGDFTQSHRDEMIRRFKSQDLDILVATDVAARGLDIPDVSHVINFSIPQDPEGYIHRVGRTGRAGKTGIAITFVTPRQYRQLRVIEQMAKTRIIREKLPTIEAVRKAREEELINEMAMVMKEGRHKGFYPLAERLKETYSLEDALSSAIHLLLGKEVVEEIAEIESGRGEFVKKGVVRLFITIGKKDRIKVPDIVRSISADAGIPADKIGNIALFDKFSFVEVPANLADRVILAINDSMMKGRKITVKHARKPEKGSKR